jgi:hypothetical protein
MRLGDALEEMLPGLEHGGVGLGKDRDEELCSDFQSSDRESSQGSILRLRRNYQWRYPAEAANAYS